MKLNWGQGLTIAMSIFILFIVTLAVILMRQDGSVEDENYYESGLEYDETMAVEKRSQLADSTISIRYSGSSVMINIGDTGILPLVNGKLHLYRPSTSDLDQKMRLGSSVDSRSVSITVPDLEKGAWEARLTWEDKDGENYKIKKDLYVE